MKNKLCVSLTEKSSKKCIEFVSSCDADIIEHRLDFMDCIESLDDIYNTSKIPVIVTCRSIKNGGRYNEDEEQRITHLLDAIKAGASYVDVEAEMEQSHLSIIKQEATRNECKVIISKHFHQDTPNSSSLIELLAYLGNAGADIMKVVTTPENPDDCFRVLQLYAVENRPDVPLIAFGMGHLGKITRVCALFLGAPFMYVSQDYGDEAAPGQIPLSLMRTILEVLQ